MKKGVDYIAVGVSYFCHDGKGNYLMNKRSKNCRDEHGRWDIGGGSVDFGDTVEETLRKELKEEYCVEKIIDQEFLGYRDVFREQEGQRTHWIQFFYRVRVDPKEVKNGEPHKFDEISWFQLDNLPTPLHSQIQAQVDRYKNK